MPRDFEQRGKDNRARGAPKEQRDAPTRADVDTSSVRHTLSRGHSGLNNSADQPAMPHTETIYTEQAESGGITPPLSRHGRDTVPSVDRGESSLRFERDSGLRQQDDGAKRKPLRMENKDGPATDNQAQGDHLAESPARESCLQFTKDETPPGRDRDVVSDKAKAARKRADKAATKLDAARETLPKTHHVGVEKTFDEKRGRMKRKLVFEEEVKSRRAHLKGTPVLRPVNAAKNAAIGYGHKKIYEVEHENVGTEAAHKGELLAEGGLRGAYRAHKTAPYRRVARLEKKRPACV